MNHSFRRLHESAQRPFGVMQAGFDRSNRHPGDAGDFFEREIFDDMQQKSRALGHWQSLNQAEELISLFTLQQERSGIAALQVGGIADNVSDRSDEHAVIAPKSPPMLNAFLVRDSENPRRESCVVAEVCDVADSSGECFLDNVERRRFVLENLSGIGVKRELMPFEQRVPSIGCILTDGFEEIGLGWVHVEPLQSGMMNAPKGSMRRNEIAFFIRLVTCLRQTRFIRMQIVNARSFGFVREDIPMNLIVRSAQRGLLTTESALATLPRGELPGFSLGPEPLAAPSKRR